MILLTLILDTTNEVLNTLDQIIDNLTFSKAVTPKVYDIYETQHNEPNSMI